MSQRDLGLALDKTEKVAQTYVSKMEAREAPPEPKTLVRLPALLECDGHWLLTGEGTPARKDGWKLGAVQRILNADAPSDELVADLLRVVRLLPVDGGTR